MFRSLLIAVSAINVFEMASSAASNQHHIAKSNELEIGSFVVIDRSEFGGNVAMLTAKTADQYEVLTVDHVHHKPVRKRLAANQLFRWPTKRNPMLPPGTERIIALLAGNTVILHHHFVTDEMTKDDYEKCMKIIGADIFERFGSLGLNLVSMALASPELVQSTSKTLGVDPEIMTLYFVMLRMMIESTWSDVELRGNAILEKRANHIVAPSELLSDDPSYFTLSGLQRSSELNGRRIKKVGDVQLTANRQTFAFRGELVSDAEHSDDAENAQFLVKIDNLEATPNKIQIINECKALLVGIIRKFEDYDGDFDRFEEDGKLVRKLAASIHDNAEYVTAGSGFGHLVEMVDALKKNDRTSLHSKYAERWFDGIGRFMA